MMKLYIQVIYKATKCPYIIGITVSFLSISIFTSSFQSLISLCREMNMKIVKFIFLNSISMPMTLAIISTETKHFIRVGGIRCEN